MYQFPLPPSPLLPPKTQCTEEESDAAHIFGVSRLDSRVQFSSRLEPSHRKRGETMTRRPKTIRRRRRRR